MIFILPTSLPPIAAQSAGFRSSGSYPPASPAKMPRQDVTGSSLPLTQNTILNRIIIHNPKASFIRNCGIINRLASLAKNHLETFWSFASLFPVSVLPQPNLLFPCIVCFCIFQKYGLFLRKMPKYHWITSNSSKCWKLRQ